MKRILVALLALVFAGCAAGPQQFMQSIVSARPEQPESPDFDVQPTLESEAEGR